MSSRIFAIGTLTVFAAISAVSAVGPQPPRLSRPQSPGAARLQTFGSRSLEQRSSVAGSKFDAALAEISRHSIRAPDQSLENLRALNPAARFMQRADSVGPMVLIDAVTLGNPQQLKAALIELGLQRAALYSNDVSGWLPVSQLDAATARIEVHSIRAAMPRTRAGAVTSQGDYAQNSDLVRSQNSLTGAGVTVGVLSDSYDCYSQFAANNVPASGNMGYAFNGFLADAAMDVSTGDLPSNVNVLEDSICMQNGHYFGYPLQLPPSDEGRAMLQIVHDVAPGASLAFRTGNLGEADFAMGIQQLADAGAKIIVDDLGYFDEPFFQDGILAQAIDTVEGQGVAYFAAAGNDGTLAYDNNAPSFATPGAGPNAGEQLLNFDTSGATNSTTLPVTIPALYPGAFVAVVVEWDQPYVTGAPTSGGATSQIDVCVTGATGGDQIADDNLNVLPTGCTGANALHADPVQVLIVGNPATGPNTTAVANINIVVGLAGGTKPGRIKVAVEGDGFMLTFNKFWTPSPTIQGHPGAAGAAAVGAAFFLNTPSCGTTPATLEYYSSAGGDPILFDVNGKSQAAVVRQKPDFVGPDGGNNTFLGDTLAKEQITDNSTIAGCGNNASYPNFFGTSAAAPHVASIAALLLQADPSLTPTQIYTVLQKSAVPIGASPNFAAGYGFVQADVAAANIPAIVPAAPALTLAASSIVVNTSTTITWSSVNTTGCTASGSWSGPLASNGTQTLTPTAAGSDTYTLACANVAGPSLPTSVTLSVTAAAPPPATGSHGGGALGLSTLLGLAGLCLARMRRSPCFADLKQPGVQGR
jgi:Subtilase family